MPTGECVNFSLGTIGAIERGDRLATPEIKRAFDSWSRLNNHYDDAALAIRSFKLIQTMLDARDIMWCFTTTPWEDTVSRIEELVKFGWFSMKNYLGAPFDYCDHVSESNDHPGVNSHLKFAERVADWLISRHEARIRELLRRK